MSRICTATTLAGDVRLAIAEIMSNDVLCNNVAAVRREARGLTTEFRYVYLRDWVLSSKNHANFRLAALQTPTDPVVPMIDDHAWDFKRQRADTEHIVSRIHTGGNLVSPAFELIATAKELGKLDDALRFLISIQDAQIRTSRNNGPLEWDRLIGNRMAVNGISASNPTGCTCAGMPRRNRVQHHPSVREF